MSTKRKEMFAAGRLIRRHELELLLADDRAVEAAFNAQLPIGDERPAEFCSCGRPATHTHDGEPVCGFCKSRALAEQARAVRFAGGAR